MNASKQLSTGFACITMWLCLTPLSFGQFGTEDFMQPFGQPSVSPYLNLLGGRNNPGVNYFGLVRPQQQFYQQSEALRQGLYSAPNTVDQSRFRKPMTTAGMPSYRRLGTTGHATAFRVLGGTPRNQAQSSLSAPGTAFGSYGNDSLTGQNENTAQGMNRPRFSGHSSGFGYGTAGSATPNGF